MTALAVLIILGIVLIWILAQSANASGVDAARLQDQPDVTREQPMSNPQSQSGVLQAIADGIAKFEGANVAGSIPNRTNNPGDILYAATPKNAEGLIGSESPGNGFTYAKFDTPQDGLQALSNWIASHAQAHPDWSFLQFYRYYVTGNPDTANAALDKNAGLIASAAGIDPASAFFDTLGVS